MLTRIHHCVRACSGPMAKAEKLILDLAQCIVQASLPGASLAQVQPPSWLQSSLTSLHARAGAAVGP